MCHTGHPSQDLRMMITTSGPNHDQGKFLTSDSIQKLLKKFQPHKITSVGGCRDFELTEENKQRCKSALGFGSDRRQKRSFQVRLEFDGHSWNGARWSGLQVIIVFLRHLLFDFFVPKQALPLPLSLCSTFNLAFRKTKLPSLSYCDTSFLLRLVSSPVLSLSLSPSRSNKP